jgi:hypothetical protein
MEEIEKPEEIEKQTTLNEEMRNLNNDIDNINTEIDELLDSWDKKNIENNSKFNVNDQIPENILDK